VRIREREGGREGEREKDRQTDREREEEKKGWREGGRERGRERGKEGGKEGGKKGGREKAHVQMCTRERGGERQQRERPVGIRCSVLQLQCERDLWVYVAVSCSVLQRVAVAVRKRPVGLR